MLWFDFNITGREEEERTEDDSFIYTVSIVYLEFSRCCYFSFLHQSLGPVILSVSDSLFTTGLEVLVKCLAEKPHTASIKLSKVFNSGLCLECPHLPLIPSHIRKLFKKTYLCQFFDRTRNPNQNTRLKKHHFTFQLELSMKLENIKIR